MSIGFEEIENLNKRHYVYYYNNIKLGDKAIIDNSSVEALYEVLKELQEYDKITLVLETGGGNLAAGSRLMHMLKRMYKEYDVTVLNRCNSTGTLIALGGQNLFITPKTIITPCEPQMEVNETKISTSVIRNILEHKDENLSTTNNLDILTLGQYYATINYFTDLCNSLYPKEKAQKIIDYMLKKINSHQYPISIEELKMLDINIKMLTNPNDIAFYTEQDNMIRDYFDDDKNEKNIETHLTLIKSRNATRAYCKVYNRNNDSYYKTFEGYKNL